MVPPGKVGFTDKDSHKEVIMNGANGLGIDSPLHKLSLLISNCLVKDVSLPSGKSRHLETTQPNSEDHKPGESALWNFCTLHL